MLQRASIGWALLVALPLCCHASLAQRQVPASATFKSGVLKVERFGNRAGRSIVFIPALFCGSWQWNAQINALSKAYDVLVVTLPGFDGRAREAGDALMSRAAESLHHLMTSEKLHRPILVGHSLGGTLAVYYAEHFPKDLTALVTVEGGYPLAATQSLRDARVAESVAPYEGISATEVGAVIRKQTLQYTITSKADVDKVEPLAARSDPLAIIAWMRAALSLDLTSGLHLITVPFTAIVPFDPNIDPYQGFKSKAAKQADYVRWVSHAPEGQVIVIEPSRHFVMFDQPKEFEQTLIAALSR